MKMSDKGRALLILWEGKRNQVYLDAARLHTIGVGHLLTKDELTSGKILILGVATRYGNGLSDLQIDSLLSHDLIWAEGVVNNSVTQSINQNQFDALISFVFNVGRQAFFSSTLRKVLNQGRFDLVPEQLRRWNRSGGVVIKGLISRRENEILLFEGLL